MSVQQRYECKDKLNSFSHTKIQRKDAKLKDFLNCGNA